MKIWNIDSIKKEALKFSSRLIFATKSGSAYNAARRLKILDEVCAHMEILRPKCTVEKVKKEAMIYKTRYAFKKNNPYYYRMAIKMEILDQVTSHMGKRINTPYTLEELKKEALKYSNRRDFDKGSNKHYRAAVRRGLLEQICIHMKYPADTSVSENDLFSIIKQRYPKSQKLKDRKVHIPDKPHIKGFDIDIYVPELRKGIEFDGSYWHSMEGLKRSRLHWPEEDILNYHKIKDDHFKSKKIEVLHIKQQDLHDNRDKVLNKIFDFLEGK